MQWRQGFRWREAPFLRGPGAAAGAAVTGIAVLVLVATGFVGAASALGAAGALGGAGVMGAGPSAQEQGPSAQVQEEGADVQAADIRDDDTSDGAIRVSDIEIPGPAMGRDPGTPNRLGSAVVPVRSYVPAGVPWATLVWAHGGSFMRGTLDWPEADWVAMRFAEAGVRVYSVDYALASETVKAPAPSNDVAAVVSWVAEDLATNSFAAEVPAAENSVAESPAAGDLTAARSEELLVVGGASAGAHLAVLAALAHVERTAQSAHGAVRAVDALVLEYPTLHPVQREDVAIAAAVAELPEQRRFRAERIAEMYEFYLGDARQGAAAGAFAVGELPRDRLALLPPTVIVNADADELRASGEQFAEQLRDAGVPVAEVVQPGTVHGYLNRPGESAQAEADARETVERFVTELRDIAQVENADRA